jgi:hypothetical protein
VSRRAFFGWAGAAAAAVAAGCSSSSSTVASTAATTATTISTTAPPASSSPSLVAHKYATTVATSGRYIKDQYGNPWMAVGNSPQFGIMNWDLASWDTFIADQTPRGFNASQIHAVLQNAADAETSTAPFGNVNNLGPLNASYWTTVRNVVRKCAAAGITVFLTLIEDYSMGSYVQAASDANCYAFGEALADYIAAEPNVVLVIGNDYAPNATRDGKYAQILAGLTDKGDTHLLTMWLNGHDSNSDTYWDTLPVSGRSLDAGYGTRTTPPYTHSDKAWTLSRTGFPKPHMWFEGWYAAEGSPPPTAKQIRLQYWWEVTWGGLGGAFFGTHATWGSSIADWQTERDADSGLIDGMYDQIGGALAFFGGLTDWQLLQPDRSHAFQTGGRGTYGSDLDSDYATASYVPSGNLAVVYFPTSRGSITFDLTQMEAGTKTAYWVDPVSFAHTAEATPAAPTHPGNNSGGDTDWLLVITNLAAQT